MSTITDPSTVPGLGLGFWIDANDASTLTENNTKLLSKINGTQNYLKTKQIFDMLKYTTPLNGKNTIYTVYDYISKVSVIDRQVNYTMNSSNIFSAGDTGATYIALFKHTAGNNSDIFGVTDSSNRLSFISFGNDAYFSFGLSTRVRFPNFWLSTDISYGQYANINGYNILCICANPQINGIDSNKTFIFLNGRLIYTDIYANTGLVTTGHTYGYSDNIISHNLAEMMFFRHNSSTNMSIENLINLHMYLKNKWIPTTTTTAITNLFNMYMSTKLIELPLQTFINAGDNYTFRIKNNSISPSTAITSQYEVLRNIIPTQYQWFKNGIAIQGQTNETLTIINFQLEDRAEYSVETTYNGINYIASTNVDIINGLPENIQRKVGESVTFSIEPIPGATYQWMRSPTIGNDFSNLTGKISYDISYSSISSNEYGVYRLSVFKNGVTGFSKDCYFTDYTSITLNNGISNTLNFTANQSKIIAPYKFIETTPDGRLVFIDSSGAYANSTLYFTEPNYVNRTTIDANIQLTVLPPPPIPTTGSLRLSKYIGLFISTSSYNPSYRYLLIDGTRSYSADGKYMAVLMIGDFNNGSTLFKKNFVQIYKLEGTVIIPVQTIIIGVSSTSFDGTTTWNNANGFPISISFSGNGNILALTYGSIDPKNIYIYTKNENSDTWGTVDATSTSRNTIHKTSISTTNSIYQVTMNYDGTKIAAATTTTSQFVLIYSYNLNNTISIDSTLTDSIRTEYITKIKTPVDTISYSVYFTPDNKKILLYHLSKGTDGTVAVNANGGSLNNANNGGFIYKLILFNYNSSENTVSLQSMYDPIKLKDVPYSVQFSRDCSYFLDTFNQDASSTTKYIYKFLNHYSNNIDKTTGIISNSNTSKTWNFINFVERSGLSFPIKANKELYDDSKNDNGWIHDNKLITFNKITNKLSIRNVEYNIQNKPVIEDTSVKIYNEQDERSTGNPIYIDSLLNNTTFFPKKQDGILLRIKNNRDASNNKVGSWKFLADYQLEKSTIPIEFSSTYSSIGEDKWYIFRNGTGTITGTTTGTNIKPYIRLDMCGNLLFDNDKTPNTKITLEYKLWNGLGIDGNDPLTKQIVARSNGVVPINTIPTQYSSFLIDGSVVTINDISNSPFSNETGTLQIYIKNVIDAPDTFGKYYTPAIPNTTGYKIDNTLRQYIFPMNFLKYSLASKPFSLREILTIFKPTMGSDYTVNPQNPYNADDYQGGIGLTVKNQYTVQISVDGGTTWNFLKNGSNTSFAYFFKLGIKNYLFRYAKTSTTNELDIYIFPWNGFEYSNTNLSTIIKEFSSTAYTISSLNEITMAIQTKVAATEIQDADSPTFPDKGKYVTGNTAISLLQSGIYRNTVISTKPAFKNTSNPSFAIKMVDNSGNSINAFTKDTDTGLNIFSFTPNDLFYGYMKNGIRSEAISIRPGTSSTDNCDVYDPDISGDQQILGLIIPRDISATSLYGTWEYTIDNGVNWINIYESPTSTNVIRFWSNRKNDDRIRIRFSPTILEKTRTVSLPFFIYDGGDFISYYSANNLESTAYCLNGTSMPILTGKTNTSIIDNSSTTSGSLNFTVKHINTPPILESTYSPLTSTTYNYNSENDISFNTYPIMKHTTNVIYTKNPTPSIKSSIATTTTLKNAFRVNIADIVNSSSIKDTVDLSGSLGIALYSGDFTNALVKVYYTNDQVETLLPTAISQSNAILIPNYIFGNPPYTPYNDILSQTFMTSTYIKGWIQPMDFSYASRLDLSSNEILTIRDRINPIGTDSNNPYIILKNIILAGGLKSSSPILVPNEINGLPVMRFDRSKFSILQPYFGTTDTNVLLKNSFIIVERPRSVDQDNYNALIGDSANLSFFFGYTSRNTITLTFNSTITLSYSDPSIDIDPSKTQTPRVWTVFIGGNADKVQLNLNGKMVAQALVTTKPSLSTTAVTRLGGYIWWDYKNLHYDGDICDIVSLAAGYTNLSQIKMFEQYLIHKWVNPQIYIEPLQNQTIDLSYNFYVWDQSNIDSLTTNYDNVQTRGGTMPYSINSSNFTIKVKKSNSRPILNMNSSIEDNSAIIPTASTSTKLVFKLGELDMNLKTHDFSLPFIFDDIIKNRYTDVDLESILPDAKGLAITSLDTTLGAWSVVKTDGTIIDLSGISTTNAFLIKRDTSGNKLRLTLNETNSTATNRLQTATIAGLPGTGAFQAIAWDATNLSYSEYSKVNLSVVADPTDIENSFSIVSNGVFEFRATTKPYIEGSTNQTLFVYNDDSSKNIITPMNYISNFTTSQITSGTKRIDIYSIANLDSRVTLQYQAGGIWTDIPLLFTSPLDGTYPIRVKESSSLIAVNKSFSLRMILYDPGTNLYSSNTGNIDIQIQEANLTPAIRIDTNATALTRLSKITSSNITYETVFNDIAEIETDEPLPTFNFKTYASFNPGVNIKPIIWTDRNISSNLKINGFAIEIIEKLNGSFDYGDENDDYRTVTSQKQTDRFLLVSINTLKYTPKSGNSGSAIVRIYAWDGVNGTVGSIAEMDESGAYSQGAFSTNYITLEFPVIPRNNAPIFITDNKLYTAIFSQTDTNTDLSGISVKSIITDTIGFDYVEPNSVNSKGLVIIDPSGIGLGAWQVSTNGGITWSTAATGLHLLTDTNETNRLRFWFDTNRTTYPQSYSETPFLRVCAWDATNNITNGTIKTINASGGPTPYSSQTVRLGATITHENHPPTLATGSTLFNLGSVNANAFVDISFQTIISAIGTDVMADPDIGTNIGLKITDISHNNTPQAGVSMGSWSYTDSILNGQYVAIGQTGAELIPDRSPVLRFTANKYVYGSTILTFRAFDGELTSSATRQLSLVVNDINYAPTFANIADISYNVTFDISRTILVSSIITALNPSDRNTGTSYGIVLSADSFNSSTAIVQYCLNPSAITPIYNTIVNSRIGSDYTAVHLPSNAAIVYTPKMNQHILNALNCVLWDRSNNSTVVSAAGQAVSVPSQRNEFAPYSASSINLIFNHIQVNFAPIITAGSATIEIIDGLSTSKSYTANDLLTRIGWADLNSGDRSGLVVVGMDICGGVYQYTVNGGASWTSIPTNLSIVNGLHLDNSTETAIRYVSGRNTTDYSTLTILGWDQTTAATYGSVKSIPATRGGNTSYSVNTYTLRIDQTHINSRPLLTAGTSRSTPAVDYSTTTYTWFRFSDYIPIQTAFSDPDYALVKRGGVAQVADKTYGILVTAVDLSAGIWYISSDQKNTTDITTVFADKAQIVSPSDYFAVSTSKNMDLSFNLTYKAWDKSNTSTNTTDLANTSYSINSGIITVPVHHTNTPPTIDSSLIGFQAQTLYGDGEDNVDPSGVSITSIIDDLVTRSVYVDADATIWGYTAEPKGLAILPSSLTTTTGTWQYSINGGSNWTTLSSSESKRLHMTYNASNRIRYIPSNNANGSASLSAIAWDQANGVANGTLQTVASTQRTGALGQTYSVNSTAVAFPTAYLNHPPRFTGSTYTLPSVEFGNVNTGKDWNTILTGLGYTDKDTLDPRGLIVDTIRLDVGLSGLFQVLANNTWVTLTTGLQFVIPAYTSLRFVPAVNITVDSLNASITIRPYDGQALGSTITTIIAPVKKALFSPTITSTLSSDLIQNFRADNKLNVFGGVNQGVSMTKLLDDMGFSDLSVGDGRGIAIQQLVAKGVDGYFEVKLGTIWTRIPTIPSNKYYLLSEKTGTITNRVRFISSSAKNSGFVSMVFYGWDLSDLHIASGIQSGSLKEFSSRPISFSSRNGTYRINIQKIVGK